METELKLDLAPDDLARMRRHPILSGNAISGPDEHEQTDTYYDTPALDLWKNGFTLRVRAGNARWTQTAKTASASSAGLHERGEWESQLHDSTPRPAQLARQIDNQDLARLLASPDIASHLHPVFEMTTRRSTWDIGLPDGQRVECALDASEIACGEQRTGLAQLELELKDGESPLLFEFALALHEDIPLTIANDSKAARGYALLQQDAIRAVKARPVRLRRKMTLDDAFQSIGLNCVQQIEANVPGVLKQDVESLHQMRVGLRRLRALLDMFRELAPLPPDIRDSLDWLAGELGATRDWDVLASSTLDLIEGLDPALLRAAAQAKAATLHKHMLRTLRAPRYTTLILQLNGWLHGRQWQSAGRVFKYSPLAVNAHDGAMPLLRKAERRLKKRIDALEESDAVARHRTRIAAKKARYAAEFFRDVLHPKSVKRYISQLSELQDRLGTLNDLAVAERLLPEFENGNASLALQAEYARGYVAAVSVADSQRLRKPLAAIAKLRMTA